MMSKIHVLSFMLLSQSAQLLTKSALLISQVADKKHNVTVGYMSVHYYSCQEKQWKGSELVANLY